MHNASALGTLAELHNGVFCLRDVRLNPGSLLQYTIFPRFPFDLVNFSTNKCFRTQIGITDRENSAVL